MAVAAQLLEASRQKQLLTPSPSHTAEQQLDLTSVDLRKLRVRELKKVLEDWGESCRGCAEKDDFVRRITELLPLHAGPPAPPPHSDL